MEPYENFKPRYSIEDLDRIAGTLTPDIGMIARKCYIETYNNQEIKHKSDFLWNQCCAFANVYLLGFLSGARAVRERKHLQQAKKNR